MIKKVISRIEETINNNLNDKNNDIVHSILEWFILFLNLFFNWAKHNIIFKKWDIYIVDLWINIWSELNKKRPCIIISNDRLNRWDCVVILPLKTIKWLNKKYFWIEIKKSSINKFEKDSYTNITDIRSVSKKRISKYIWKLEKGDLLNITKKIQKYF